jgi:cytochrome oxidase Cu insertion factor (SCO1/SenC/PrrC family)
LVERLNGIEEVTGSNPVGSTTFSARKKSVIPAKFYSRSHNAVIRVYDATGNVIETYEHKAISKSGSPLKLFAFIGSVGHPKRC